MNKPIVFTSLAFFMIESIAILFWIISQFVGIEKIIIYGIIGVLNIAFLIALFIGVSEND